MQRLYCLAVVVLLSVFADAQTETVVNPAGATVIEVISENAGIPTTHVLQTITGSTSLTTSATSTTTSLGTSTLPLPKTTAQQAGPVGQPASVTPGGATPYTYTTTDASGNTVVMQAVFTPTGPQTVLPVPTTTGSILGYSQWMSMVGTNTAPASAARRTSMTVATGWYCFAATAFGGLVGGAWLLVIP